MLVEHAEVRVNVNTVTLLLHEELSQTDTDLARKADISNLRFLFQIEITAWLAL